MDFKVDFREVYDICNQIDDNNNTLLDGINGAQKLVNDLPNNWKDSGSKTFVSKMTEYLNALKSLKETYSTIVLETKKVLEDYNSISLNSVINDGRHFTGPSGTNYVIPSEGTYFVEHFNEGTGKYELLPAPDPNSGIQLGMDGGCSETLMKKWDEAKSQYVLEPVKYLIDGDKKIPLMNDLSNFGTYDDTEAK